MISSKNKNLRPNPQALGVTLLKPDEASRPIRVRAKLEVFRLLEGLSPTQVGLILERAFFMGIAKDALFVHFSREEALALVDRKVRYLRTFGPGEREGRLSRIMTVFPRTAGDGHELELDTGKIITRRSFGSDVELVEA
jgi:hypothetical protein